MLLLLLSQLLFAVDSVVVDGVVVAMVDNANVLVVEVEVLVVGMGVLMLVLATRPGVSTTGFCFILIFI